MNFIQNYLKDYFFPVLKSYSAVLFNSSTWAGFVLLALSFLNPNVGIAGFISVVSAYIFARIIGFKSEFLRFDYYIFNPLLVGLSLGYLFKVTILSSILFFIAGIFTFLLTYTMASIFYNYLGLPVLSVPFVLVSSLFYLASFKFSNLFVYNLYPHFHLQLPFNLPLYISGFLRSLGAVFFLPNVLVGLIIFIAIFFVSRILAFLGVIGYYTGVLTSGLLTGSFYQAFTDISAFNYILTAMAIGGVFIIPSLKSYRFALLSVLLCIPIISGSKILWQSYGLPVFALPFNFTTHLLLYVLFSIGFFFITRAYKGTPERTLDHYITYIKRFPFTGREIGLPFSGKWSVWQSFDGEWTHKGAWRYAVDFVITDQDGKTYKNQGVELSDYYAFGKPVLSPVEGQVIALQNDLPDNPPGKADKENNWGNYVIIYDKRGFYVMICHFKQNSIKVKIGDYVAKGGFLGLCGNSGYSPQPHIHIQVQLLPRLGAPTVPFNFTSYIVGGIFKDVGIPKKGEIVEPVFSDKALYNKLNFLIDQEMEFFFEDQGNVYTFKLITKMAPDGSFYLTDGKAKLYFGIQNSTFYFYHLDGDTNSPLRYFLFSIPKLPLFFQKNIFWKDHLPLSTISSKIKREFYLFLTSFNHELFDIKVDSMWETPDTIKSIIYLPKEEKIALVKLSRDWGIEEINYNEKIKIKRRREKE